MAPRIQNIIINSIRFYKKPVLYQVLIIVLLSAVITGSLLTGISVKESLKKSATERLGNTGILISSGVRYFDQELVKRMNDSLGLRCTGILEMNGYSQPLGSQKGAFNTHIFGINKDFFIFHGSESIAIKPGEVAINRGLADFLGIRIGDDIIIRFTGISDIPPDAPFAPAGTTGRSIVTRVGNILEQSYAGNFSLSISQITPMNIFINLADIEDDQSRPLKMNRILISRHLNNSIKEISGTLKHYLKPADIGLRLRTIKKTGEHELISDRIFIDESVISEIGNKIPGYGLILTYLGNRLKAGERSTPYSFVSALPPSLYPEIPTGNGIIINKWMANDLSVNAGDTLKMYWYTPDSLNKLIEKSGDFIVRRIVDIEGIWADSLLMPDFPGISGKESCSDWDAGVPVKMNEIRPKDEEYWKRYKGTPKAFISYGTGRELWGNNFGPATAIRFPSGVTQKEINYKLSGSLEPDRIGFTITDLAAESVKAANESVDFGSLFLGLGFFLLLASLVLLSFATSSYFESKKRQINTLFALGFKNRRIEQILILETGLTGLTGCVIGAFAGYLFDIITIKALNTVWNGAVQTDNLHPYFNLLTLITGALITFITIMVLNLIKVIRFLKRLNKKGKETLNVPSRSNNLFILLLSILLTISLFVLSILMKEKQILLSFSSGTLLLISLVLLSRQFYIRRSFKTSGSILSRIQLSHKYYTFNSSNAVTPILFIAAGIFTVFITGANRMNFNEKQAKRSGGTGGYLLWCENTIAVKEQLNTESGRRALGLDDGQLSELRFVPMKRSQGNDASCLNLNHIKVPPLLGVDPMDFIAKKAFSFSKVLTSGSIENPWQFLNISLENNTIYGIADQTVLDWGLKLKPGDTLVVRAENGQPVRIIIAAGLQSSVFQGNLLIGMENFMKYYPSVSGSAVLLADGNSALTGSYKNTLTERLENYGPNIENTTDRLASFFKVTNTYLSVFGVFGALGMITGIAGLGFVLLRNFNLRKQEFSLLMATGFHIKKIRRMILSEQLLILFAGITSGIISALVATLPSITGSPDIPWLLLILMVLAILITGLTALFFSVRSISSGSLTATLNKE